uniref:Uncharacterized protein n=1 Tax=Meloidogyne hapla TaxID=6305 RepID=A0A1I8C1Z7_MELHA
MALCWHLYRTICACCVCNCLCNAYLQYNQKSNVCKCLKS